MSAESAEANEALYRAAVGPNNTDFYVLKFVQFDQPAASDIPSKTSWNWPAFFGPFYWFFYRRMYGYWAVFCVAIPLALVVVQEIAVLTLGARAGQLVYFPVKIAYLVLVSTFANALYHRKIKQQIASVRRRIPDLAGQIAVLENGPHTNGVGTLIVLFFGLALVILAHLVR